MRTALIAASLAALWLLQGIPAVAASTPLEAAAASTPIETAAADIQRMAGERRLILVGEMHGTREVPQLMATLVERYAQHGPVLLGLELPRDGQVALKAYLRSEGSTRHRNALRAQRFLQPADGHNDGRRSEDVLDMVERVRVLRAAGRDVAILPFDVTLSGGGAEERDRDMADYLRSAYRALPRGRLVVVTGNVHAMHVRPDFPDAAKFQTPMGSHLADLSPYSVDVNAVAGEFWACAPGCGPQPARASSSRSGPASGAFRDSFDYQVVLPRFTPARVF